MAELRQRIADEVESLKTLRDEIRVKANLSVKEIRDLWQDAEHKWSEVEAKRHALAQASVESAREVAAALEVLNESLREAYKRIRSKL
jgi:myo-inositol-1-phosphate synthase